MAHALDAVVDFLLQERYLLSALELLHEITDNGAANSEPLAKLQSFFADPEVFPPDQLLHFQSLQGGGDPQVLVEEKNSALEKAAVLEYELRLAQEDIKALQEKLETATKGQDCPETPKSSSGFSQTGNKELNCAVKEYLVSAGYKLTAMTFCEEVDQDLDNWTGAGRVPNALREYHRAFLSCGTEELKMAAITPDLKAVEARAVEVEVVRSDLEAKLSSMSRALESSQTECKEKNHLVRELSEALQQANLQLDAVKKELALLLSQQENSIVDEPELDKEKVIGTVESVVHEDQAEDSTLLVPHSDVTDSHAHCPESVDSQAVQEVSPSPFHEASPSPVDEVSRPPFHEEPDTIQILAESLPKIVPYVLINHREELLPLMICAIARHPDSSVRDSLTHTLFNLIKRPDQEQRRIIMDACMSLSMSVGDLRTETELLPQCWEQIDHKYEERRLLVAQSCGELGRFVRPDMRSSLILSILEQLVGDPADVVREAASRNLAMLLPLFPNTNKFTKVEEMLFQLLADPSGKVVDTTLTALVPAVLTWSSALRQVLSTLLNRMLSFPKHCPPISGVADSSESQLRSLGERERWNIEVLLRVLIQLLPDMLQSCLSSCPFTEIDEALGSGSVLTEEVLEHYLDGPGGWDDFDWFITRLFPSLLQLACMLSPKEETLRRCMCQLLLSFHQCFGEHCHRMVVLPIFLTAVGDESVLSHTRPLLASKIRCLTPQTVTAEGLAMKCILPLLLAGVLGVPSNSEERQAVFVSFLKELILQSSLKHGPWSRLGTSELVEAMRFLSLFKDHHGVLTSVLWELVVNTNASVKVNAALLLKELVPYASTDLVRQQLLPALVTLGSDTNLDVKYTSIAAFGTVAQNFREDSITEKIRVQMDAFLDEGSNEAIVGVVRALTIAVPLAAPTLRDYLLQKLVVLTANTTATSLARRRDKANAFCEAIRCLDGTDLTPTSVRELLLPAIQSLMKDPEVLDPAHKEALEMIVRERSGFKFEAISKVMGNMSSIGSMTSIFGDAGAAGASSKKDLAPISNETVAASQVPASPQEEGMFKRMMRTNFGDMIKGRGQ